MPELKTNRIEIIVLMTDWIMGTGITEIKDRDDAAMIAIAIRDGFESIVVEEKEQK